MSTVCKIIEIVSLLGTIILTVFLAITIQALFFKVPDIPKLENTWWGSDDAPKIKDNSIKPFKINISNEILLDLARRLDQARPFTQPLEGIQQQYGMNTNLLTEIIEFWTTKYNWREREKFLNKFPQFTTKIQGLNIHFIHAKPTPKPNQRVLPLLILHGWGGSIREFYEMIPFLISPKPGRDFVFEVIAPSLPGFAFSQAAAKPGLGVAQMSVIFRNLMERLGFREFYLQGGDFGGAIAAIMAAIYPKNVLGIHSNMCVVNSPLSNFKLIMGSLYPPLVVEEEFQERLYPLGDFYSNLILESGYFHMHATKPDTLGVAFQDSPVGFVAYMLEKFSTWTNPNWKNKLDGGLTEKYTLTQLLDNVMIYWVTNSITTSMRIYAETVNFAYLGLQAERIPIKVPSACAKFKYELVYLPDSWLRERYTQLVQSNNFPVGGHFAAFEEPELLANDIWSAVGKFEVININQRVN